MSINKKLILEKKKELKVKVIEKFFERIQDSYTLNL